MGFENETARFMLDGFQCMVGVGLWSLAVLIHGLFWRSLRSPAPDPVRPSGPIG